VKSLSGIYNPFFGGSKFLSFSKKAIAIKNLSRRARRADWYLDMSNRGCVFDLTFDWDEAVSVSAVRKFLDKLYKKWAGKPEIGDLAEKRHGQFRGSLYNPKGSTAPAFARACAKKYLPAILSGTFHLSKTSAPAAEEWRKGGIARYVEKFDEKEDNVVLTSDDPKPTYVPWQIRDDDGNKFQYNSWQAEVIANCKQRSRRTIHCIVDPVGNIGKGTLVGLAYVDPDVKIRRLPPVNTYNDLMEIGYDILEPYKQGEWPTGLMVDLPRALDWKKLREFCGGLESIKDGWVFDKRYRYKELYFDAPQIWVFTNAMPDKSVFSSDRWKFYSIQDNKLVSA
jgi:hypothetical protein